MEHDNTLIYLLGSGVMAIGGAIIKGLCDRALRQMDETIVEQGKAIQLLQVDMGKTQTTLSTMCQDMSEIKGDIKQLLRRGGGR